jgi:hypothetical protein
MQVPSEVELKLIEEQKIGVIIGTVQKVVFYVVRLSCYILKMIPNRFELL